MEKIAAFFCACFLFLSAALSVQAAELYYTATYFEHTGQALTVAWDAVPGATGYDWRIKSVERQKYIIIDGQAEHHTKDLKFVFVVPFLGHFVAEVRATDSDGNQSKWAKSDSYHNATVKGKKRGWWIYGHMAPAGKIEITKGEKSQ